MTRIINSDYCATGDPIVTDGNDRSEVRVRAV